MDWPANAGGFVCQCLAKTAPFVGDHEIAFFTCSSNKIKSVFFQQLLLLAFLALALWRALNALEHKRSSFLRAPCAFVQQPMKIGLLSLFVQGVQKLIFLVSFDNK